MSRVSPSSTWSSRVVSLVLTASAAGCTQTPDWVVDATAVEAVLGDVRFQADAVVDGEARASLTLQLGEQTVGRVEDGLIAAGVWGIAAYADKHGDGHCVAGTDPAWLWFLEPGNRPESLWVVDMELFREDAACVWFEDSTFSDTDAPGETDETDSTDVDTDPTPGG